MLKKNMFKIKFPYYIQYLLNYFFIKKYKVNIEHNYNIKKFNCLLEILQQKKKYRYSINSKILITPIEGKIKNIKKYGVNNVCLEFIQDRRKNHVIYTPIDSILLSVENLKNKKIINFLIKNTDIKYQITILLKDKNINELKIENKKEFKKSDVICKLPLTTIIYISFNNNDIKLLNYIEQNFEPNLGIGIAKIKKRKKNAKNGLSNL